VRPLVACRMLALIASEKYDDRQSAALNSARSPAERAPHDGHRLYYATEAKFLAASQFGNMSHDPTCCVLPRKLRENSLLFGTDSFPRDNAHR